MTPCCSQEQRRGEWWACCRPAGLRMCTLSQSSRPAAAAITSSIATCCWSEVQAHTLLGSPGVPVPSRACAVTAPALHSPTQAFVKAPCVLSVLCGTLLCRLQRARVRAVPAQHSWVALPGPLVAKLLDSQVQTPLLLKLTPVPAAGAPAAEGGSQPRQPS